ncbi:shikimate 5-dehydrogenase [Mycetocola reblochoni]|nr:shikimate 5-dehydrogenase [Mycetocola reblochoni]RLP70670.1 shikimate 5-dehydrogenase [Mycetocola reblochoni]
MTRAPHAIDAETVVCISLSSRPTNIGTRFHNFLAAELGLNLLYKAFRTTDIVGAIAGVRALGIRGCSVSMPHKESVIPLVDALEPSARAIGSVNTIVNDDGVLTASNTDYLAIETLMAERNVDPALPVLLRGTGGMAKAIAAVLHARGAEAVTVLSRTETAGAALAARYGFRATTSLPSPGAATLINATPIGMTGPDASALAFPADHVAAASTVIDVVASPWRTPLIAAAEDAGVERVSGDAVIALQAAKQFTAYTGVELTRDQVDRAARYSQATPPR